MQERSLLQPEVKSEYLQIVRDRKTISIVRGFAAPLLYLGVLVWNPLSALAPSGYNHSYVSACFAISFAAVCVVVFAFATGLKIKVSPNQFNGSSWVVVLFFVGLTTSVVAIHTGYQPGSAILLRVVVLSILIGVAEEITFRGVLLESLSKPLGSGTALFISSVIFGLGHFLNELNGQSFASTKIQAVSATVGGLFFGWLYLKMGGGVWIIAIAHAVYDATIFIVSLTGVSLIDVVIFVIVVPVCVLLRFWIRRATRHQA